MKRSGSQSSASSHSASWTEKTEFPSYEDLFYRPPMPEVPGFGPKIMNGLVCEEENEAPIRALLDEMRDWYVEQSEEAESRLHKPLPPPPVEESDDEDAIRKPFGAARALRKVVKSHEQFHPIPPTPPLRLKMSVPSIPSSASPGPKTPTSFSAPRRAFADVPQSPISEAFVDPPFSAPPLQSSIRARSSSLPLCPPPALKTMRSDADLRRPPPLRPSSKSLSVVQDNVLLQPGFNKSFSAPNTPTAAEFMQAKTDRLPNMLHVHHSPYNYNTIGNLPPRDSHLRAATNSRWSLSTAAQDDNPPLSPLSTSQPSPTRRGLPRSPSRLGLGLTFAKFELMKLVRLPARAAQKKRLIIKGVASGEEDAIQNVRAWCEVFGAVDRVSQKTNGEIHVHFRNRVLADRVCRTHTDVMIVGAGIVSLSYGGSSRQK